MLTIDVNKDSIKSLKAFNKEVLQKLQGKLRDNSIPFREARILLYKDIMQHFKDEEGSDKSWDSLKYRKGRPLQDTGRLRLSIQTYSDKDRAVIVTNLIYAKPHNYGRGKIPQREFM